MKKFLSLVLSLVMAMSLVTIGASANETKDFTDNSTIQYKEAVDVISALKVVDGYTNGSFQPTSTLTRGAAAKIICNMVLGTTTAGALGCDTKPFKDVAVSNPFAGYIAYCSTQKIISGYADGTFRPAGTVTGFQFMKMLLGALGYDSSIEGFTGANWTVNVAKLASSIGLDDGNDNFVGSKAMTREEACLYAFNTLTADMVEYDTTTSVSVNGATVNVGGSKYKKVTNNLSDDYRTAPNSDRDTTQQFCEKYFDDLTQTNKENDDFGRPAKEWKNKSTTIGTYVDDSDLQSSYTKAPSKGDLYSVIGKTAYDDLTDGKSTLTVYVDGVESSIAKANISSYIDKNNTGDVTSTDKGVQTEVYLDDDNNVTIVIINTYVFQATENYSSSDESVKVKPVGDTDKYITLSDSKLSQDDVDVQGVQKDDYILVTASHINNSTTSKCDPQTATIAKVVEGTVTSYSNGNSVTIGGTKYDYSAMTKPDGERNQTFSNGTTARVVVDAYGYIICVDEAQSSNSYVYITSTDNRLDTVTAKAYFADGTSKVITLNKVTKADGTSSSGSSALAAAYGWYTYSVTSDSEYNLNQVCKNNTKYTTYYGVADKDGLYLDKTADTSVVTYNNGSYDLTSNTNLSAAVTTVGSNVDGSHDKFIANGNSLLANSGLNDPKCTIYSNSKTIYVVVDKDNDVTTYTGTANAPTVRAGTTADKGTAKYGIVSYVVDSDGYAKYVFVDMSKVSDSVVDEGASTSTDYMFVLKCGDTYTNDNKDYTEFNVISDGKDETVKADTDTTLTVGKLYNNIKMNKDSIITDAQEIASNRSDKFDSGSITNVDVTYSNGSLYIGGSNRWNITDKSVINLIIAGKVVSGNTYGAVQESVQPLMNQKGSKYEDDLNISGSTLESQLKGYQVTGSYYVIRTESDKTSTTVDQVYIWITDATPDATQATTYSIDTANKPADISNIAPVTGLKAGDTVTVTMASAGKTLTAPSGVTLKQTSSTTYTFAMPEKNLAAKDFTVSTAYGVTVSSIVGGSGNKVTVTLTAANNCAALTADMTADVVIKFQPAGGGDYAQAGSMTGQNPTNPIYVTTPTGSFSAKAYVTLKDASGNVLATYTSDPFFVTVTA